MTPQSGRSLTWASLLLLLVGGLVGSPEAGVAAAVLAALCAVAPVVSGARRARIAGLVLLVAAAGLAVARFAPARSSMDAYRDRARAAEAGTKEGR